MIYDQVVNGGASSSPLTRSAQQLQSIALPLPLPPHHQFGTNPYYGFFQPPPPLASSQASQQQQQQQQASFNFSPQHRQNSQDFLNSSQTEKSWLNSSLNEKNWLNNSLNLPAEQRYQSLNEMVSKIVEDEKNLLASGNASTLLSMRSMASHQLQQHHHQQQQQQKQQPFQIHQSAGGHVPSFYRQDSAKSRYLFLIDIESIVIH